LSVLSVFNSISMLDIALSFTAVLIELTLTLLAKSASILAAS